MRRTVVGLVLAGVLGLAACSAGTPDGPTADSDSPSPAAGSGSPSPSVSPVPVRRARITLGVFGNSAEVSAYRQMARVYDAISTNATVTVESWPDRDALVRALRDADAAHPVPDLFLASRSDLGLLRARGLNRPVDELLDERNVDFGDGYSRDSIEGFSLDQKLQCMPYAVSPVVAYYNTDLVDFPAMAAAGLEVPSSSLTRWDLDQFTAALHYASRPGTGAAGLAVDPTLSGIAPLLYAAGGRVYGDGTPPTSLAVSSSETRDALATILPLLRDPRLTLSPAQMRRATPEQWFARGKVGVILGTRALVPRLRAAKGLRFDVISVPSISTSATVGDVIGLCLSATTRNLVPAADFLAWATSPDAVRIVTRTGYVVPTNQQVALTADFTQPLDQPFHASVFTSAVRSMVLPPFLDDAAALDRAVDPLVARLLEQDLAPAADDPRLVRITGRIDARSQQLLAPPVTVETSPSADPSADPGASPQP